MSTVIIELDKARAERLVELLKERGADENNFMLKQVKPQLEGKCKRSMIDWHVFDEKPESGEAILMLWRDGSINTVYPGDEWPAMKSVRAWAYLPD